MTQQRWLLLTHQLPAEPSNVRVKVWRKLQSLGAVPVKNSIYVLPNTPASREDFDWLRKEIQQMKGEASVFVGDSISDLDDKHIVRTFQDARAKDFDRFVENVRVLSEKIKSALEGGHVNSETFDRLEKQWNSQKGDLESLLRIDFFNAPNRSKAKNAAASTQKAFQKAKALSLHATPTPPPAVEIAKLQGRVWVTRTSPHIDRLASAWLIRRYVDPKARFKFVVPPYQPRSAKEVRFDMGEAEFTHFGDWCTFETLMKRLRLAEPALTQVAEIVHDIDLKDRKFARLEAPGLAQIVKGLCRKHGGDQERVEAGLLLFDSLYASFGEDKR